MNPRIKPSYYTSVVDATVQAAADAAGIIRGCLANPGTGGVVITLLRVTFRCQISTILATPTDAQIFACLFTYASGSPAGGGVATVAKQESIMPNATGQSGNAVGTLAGIAEGATVARFKVLASATAVGIGAFGESRWDGVLTLGALQGILFRQGTAGTIADTRKWSVDLEWRE